MNWLLDWRVWDTIRRLSASGWQRWQVISASISGFIKMCPNFPEGRNSLLNLAAIMAMHPKLLILDEPTSQLDPIAASDFLETVRKINRDIGTTVILTEHRLQDVIPWADKVYVLDKGSLLTQGTPRGNRRISERGSIMECFCPCRFPCRSMLR